MLRNHAFRAAAVLSGALFLAGIEPACAQAPSPPASASAAANPIAQRLATGGRYVIVTRRDLFPRPSQGNDWWFAITGYYVPRDGTWTSSASGFPTPGTPWHSCPAETSCGGIHERGMVLERWYRPEQNEIVAVGERLTFDAEGRLFHQGRHIGYVIAADIPDS